MSHILWIAAFAIYDGFPVKKGHMLIIPKKHVKDYFETNERDKDGLWKLIDECKEIVDKKFNPDGYKIGVNCGEIVGQIVHNGDINNPKGGVRGVIPNKRIY